MQSSDWKPVIGGAIGGAAGTLALAVAPRAVAHFRKKSISILGREGVGKTTLLTYLAEGKLPPHRTRTADPVQGRKVTLEVKGKKSTYSIPKDLPGDPRPSYKDWETGYKSSDFVLYLFRADRIAAGDEQETQLVREHLDYLRNWHATKADNKQQPPQILLVGVFADLALNYSDDGEFESSVKSAPVIDRAAHSLGKANTIVGSQVTEGAASELVERISRYLS